MKSKCMTLIILPVFLFLLASGGIVRAATESWVTDMKTGVKVGLVSASGYYTLIAAAWSGPAVDGKAEGKGNIELTLRGTDGKNVQGQGEAEMRAGLMDGKATIKWSDGDFIDGYYKAGLLEKGLYRNADGRSYEGPFKNGQPDGYGVGKNSEGKIIHDGEWKNGQPVIPLKADKVLGIPWDATDEQAKKILLQRPNTKAYSFMNGKDANDRWNGYSGPFADFNDAEIFVHFYQDKMWMVQISWPLKEDQVLDRFNTVKQGLTERYGSPASEKGKYLDSLVLWNLGGAGRGYTVNVQIRKNTIRYIASVDPAKTHPFRVFITYYNQSVADLMNSGGSGKTGGGSKDY